MHLEVTFKNLRPREEIRRRAQALHDKLDRFLDPASTSQLTVEVEHGRAILELVVHTKGGSHKVEAEHDELRHALDKLFHTVEEKLRRKKEKRIDKARRGHGPEDGFVAGAEGEEGEEASL
jgi:ribosomal subunit interface protein